MIDCIIGLCYRREVRDFLVLQNASPKKSVGSDDSGVETGSIGEVSSDAGLQTRSFDDSPDSTRPGSALSNASKSNSKSNINLGPSERP